MYRWRARARLQALINSGDENTAFCCGALLPVGNTVGLVNPLSIQHLVTAFAAQVAVLVGAFRKTAIVVVPAGDFLLLHDLFLFWCYSNLPDSDLCSGLNLRGAVIGVASFG